MAIITYKRGEFRSRQTGKNGLAESLVKAQPGDVLEAHTEFQAEVFASTIAGFQQIKKGTYKDTLKGVSVKIKGQEGLFYDASQPLSPEMESKINREMVEVMERWS